MFKVGDEVVCVDEVEPYLKQGSCYTVTEVRANYIKVKGCSYEWLPRRFVLESAYSVEENLKEHTALDIQHGGQHYKGMKIQPVEFIHANNIGYMEGNCIKYLCRWQMKNGLEDLNKAKHYIELLIEMENKRNESKD